jgi:hypothetical protein
LQGQISVPAFGAAKHQLFSADLERHSVPTRKVNLTIRILDHLIGELAGPSVHPTSTLR